MTQSKDPKKREKISFPNFFGTEFLVSISRLFLEWAELAEASAAAQQEFSAAIMPDFLDKATATLLAAVGKEKLDQLMALSGRQMFFEEREAKLKELIPDYELEMKALLNFFRKRIERGYYYIPENQ